MDEETLAAIRHNVGLVLWGTEMDGRPLPDDVRLMAEVDRLRSEIEEQAAHQIETAKDWDEDNPEAAGILRMEAQNLRNILTPPEKKR